MATRYPTSLDAFCDYYNIAFFNLNLRCLFCNSVCSLEDLAGFFIKQLALVWKGEHCFATCRECVYKAAEAEYLYFHRGTINAVDIEHITGVPIQCILCRCAVCLKVLSEAEKIACIGRGLHLHLVQNTWRGLCSNCMNLP